MHINKDRVPLWSGAAFSANLSFHVNDPSVTDFSQYDIQWFLDISSSKEIANRLIYIDNYKYKICLSDAYVKSPHVSDSFLRSWKGYLPICYLLYGYVECTKVYLFSEQECCKLLVLWSLNTNPKSLLSPSCKTVVHLACVGSAWCAFLFRMR